MTTVASFGFPSHLGIKALNKTPEAAIKYILELGTNWALTRKHRLEPINRETGNL